MVIEGNDPFTEPCFGFGHRLRRQLWNLLYIVGFRPSPRHCHGWRSFLLRLFGARLGKGCHVYPAARVWAPWNLELGAHVGVADGAILYSMDRIVIGDYAVISQGAHLCGGTHDYNSANFQLVVKPIEIGARAWICAEAFIHPGVVIPEGAVVGARSVVVKSLPTPWTVYAGNPCVEVGPRQETHRVDGVQ